jgi:hypothetical protein
MAKTRWPLFYRGALINRRLTRNGHDRKKTKRFAPKPFGEVLLPWVGWAPLARSLGSSYRQRRAAVRCAKIKEIQMLRWSH